MDLCVSGMTGGGIVLESRGCSVSTLTAGSCAAFFPFFRGMSGGNVSLDLGDCSGSGWAACFCAAFLPSLLAPADSMAVARLDLQCFGS